MLRILISAEHFFKGETKIANQLLEDCKFDIFHIRKPFSSESDILQYLKNIDNEYYNKIVLHSNYRYSLDFNLRGIHINNKSKIDYDELQNKYNIISIACHSFEDIEKYKNCNCEYLFLSPIYDSISKVGYKRAFSNFELKELLNKTKKNVIAMGGITENNISECEKMGFGGYAMLGAVWNNYTKI
jgi:thiamine-phosphate pyrophosphorylase